MQELNEDKLTEIVIDFQKMREKQDVLNEDLQDAFGYWISTMLKSMYGVIDLPVRISGTPTEVRTFGSAVAHEKKYIDTAIKYGLNDPRTYKDRGLLQKAVSAFERATNIKWPFK